MGKLEVRARNWLGREIHAGKFPIGSYLPAVEDMAAKAQCGPATMRQALNELARESVVKPSKRWGTRVLRKPPVGKVCLLLSRDGDTNTLFHQPLSETLMGAGYDVDILPWYLESPLTQDQLRRILSGGTPTEHLVAISPESLSPGAHAHLLTSLSKFSKRIFISIDAPAALTGVEVVHVDQQAAARKVITHLLKLGHRRIGVGVGASLDDSGSHAQSARFCRDLCEVAGARFTALTFQDRGKKLLERIRKKQLTALWDLNDHAALLTSAFLSGAGLSVPKNLSLIGRNNARPNERLTTISLNPAATARKVAEILGCDGTGPVGPFHLIEPKLIARQSTGPAPRGA